ncbi:MAG: YncE family protein [Thermodesulfovibrionia bacterium]|nr:YncE family protein [Thermodesulfovibrionia bacterium]
MNNKKNKLLLFFILNFFLLTVLYGCTAAIEEHIEPPGLNEGQVSLFLNGPEKSSLDISFDLSAVTIVSEDGTPRDVLASPLRINSYAVTGRQVLLGERSLPEGAYTKLFLTVKEASIRKNGRMAHLALPPDGIEIAIDIKIRKRQNTVLFLSWNPDNSVSDKYLFDPAFAVKGQIPELSTLLIYVTNEGSNNVSVINRELGEVVATIMVGDRPRGIAAGSRREQLRIYVANSGADSISVIDPTVNKVENVIPIRFGKEPEGIAVARLSYDKELIFVTNYSSNTVSVVDAMTFQETEKVDVGLGPVAVAVDPPIEDLAGTRFLAFEDINVLRGYRKKFLNIYVANRNSNSVSVLRMDVLTGKCVEVVDIDVEWRPIALSVDYQRGKVYVANYGSDKLSVIDIVELSVIDTLKIVKGDMTSVVSTINNIGTFITGIITDTAFDRIYLLKQSPGEIEIIRPFDDNTFDALKTIKPPVMGFIPVGKSPRSFILDPETRKIYVVNRGSNNMSVIDKITRKEEQVIPLGKDPYGIAIFSR